MDSLLKNLVRIQVSNLSGFDFQKFIISLLRIHYGNDNIQEVRRVKDQGADCLIRLGICVACYAPEKAGQAGKMTKKLHDDFGSYQSNWQRLYPDWHFYTNLEPAPEHIRQVADWGWQHKICGLGHILYMIETDSGGRSRPYPQKYRLYRELNIGDEYLGRDFVEKLLDDLCSQNYETDQIDYLEKAPEILHKIRSNSTESEHEEFENSIKSTYPFQAEIEEVLNAYTDRDINTVKNRIFNDYGKLASLPLSGFQKMKQLIANYEERYNGELKDDMLSAYISALVWYVFSQCHIGTKPGGDQNGTITSRK
ncbi:hypothetical protein [Neisseria sp.]|uniref:hypothetical protein n=1 Tax=Neisseria sp. TaxID=192066 RepID=UPI0035A06E52